MFFEVFQDKRGEFRWRIKARNGRICGTSGEGYTRKRDAFRAIHNTMKGLLSDKGRYTARYRIKDLTIELSK